ncbi:MAG TPA: ABC transporter permease [Gemmataceae bacterium]|nr:ABC transporter permease [Gemmataceae bacterium]
MYKVLLCWRYLLTRYLALACIVSVMLGVATLIVVNSVMSGFSTKLRDRLHGLLSDVLIEYPSYEGFADPEAKIARIREDSFLNDRIESMTSTLEIFAMLQFRIPNGEMVLRPVHLIGVDPEERAKMPGFAEFLMDAENRLHPSFELRGEVLNRYQANHPMMMAPIAVQLNPNETPPPDAPEELEELPGGIILGNAIASFRRKGATAESEVKDLYLLERGDEVIITTVNGRGDRLRPIPARFVVTAFFKSEMSEYDGNYVFVSKKKLQELRGMENRVSSILIKLKNNLDSREVKERLEKLFPNFMVQTWEDKQGPLLAAISVERGILNVLLFLIVGVAGFGILAIFTMIVVEKTRDIGILKALGASNGGVMKIFLGYGLLLGVVGACLGTILGLLLTAKINGLEQWLGKITGRDLFPRDIYYFDKIPTDVQFWAVVLVNVGAIGISVIASVLPALRAALLHPVRALRYE